VVSYLGSYYPGRQDLSAAWAALARLAAYDRSRPVRLRVIGTASEAMRGEVRAHGIESLLEETGFVPHAEALRVASSSSVLLVAGPTSQERAGEGVVPAKLFEYLATGLPIVWVGLAQNDGAVLLREHQGCYVFATEDTEGVLALLSDVDTECHERDLTGLSVGERTGELAAALAAHLPVGMAGQSQPGSLSRPQASKLGQTLPYPRGLPPTTSS
jgi:glycosyltransferase involved in cell wall biosynthesis